MRRAINCRLPVCQHLPKDKLAYVAQLGILVSNTPAMPLLEAHFGGFFLPGISR